MDWTVKNNDLQGTITRVKYAEIRAHTPLNNGKIM